MNGANADKQANADSPPSESLLVPVQAVPRLHKMDPAATGYGGKPPLYEPNGTISYTQWKALVTNYINTQIAASPETFTGQSSTAIVCAAIKPGTYMSVEALRLSDVNVPTVWMDCSQVPFQARDTAAATMINGHYTPPIIGSAARQLYWNAGLVLMDKLEASFGELKHKWATEAGKIRIKDLEFPPSACHACCTACPTPTGLPDATRWTCT